MTDYKDAINRPSPNYWPGRAGHEVLYVVMHGTDGSCPGAVDWLCDAQSGASVHYVVGRTGTVWQLVSESDSAWGNGIIEAGSIFTGESNPNLYTVSIEHERTDGNTSPITEAQQAASTALVADIRKRHGPVPLIPHSSIAPQSRAHCPGPNFPLAEIDAAAHAPAQGITWTRFTGTPLRLPLVFYAGADFTRPLYTSAAGTGTVLSFDGWQRGTPVAALSGADAADARWYHRHNPQGQQGWCPASWVRGGP